jgi:hypothetical protein
MEVHKPSLALASSVGAVYDRAFFVKERAIAGINKEAARL